MAKVSIIIPVYNVEKYLVECMDSVVGQTLKDIEIVCVNDGSTDKSLSILKQYQSKDKRIILIDKKNGGYGQAMNYGLKKATGEYIGIVEPDDFVPVNMYEKLYEKASEHNLDFVKADFFRFTTADDGQLEKSYIHLSPNQEDYNVVFSPTDTPLAMKYVMNTWSGIYKRDFLEQYHILHNETPGASFQDNGFWFQTFAYAKKAMIIDQPFYMNRRDNPNSSVNSREKVYCINQEYDYIRSLIIKNPDLWNRFKSMYWFKKYHNYKWTIWRIDEKYREEFVERFANEFRWAKKKGELDFQVFSKSAWDDLSMLMDDSGNYYKRRVYPASVDKELFSYMEELTIENMKLRRDLEKLKNSKSYRFGKMATALPRKIRDTIKNR